MLKTEPCHHGFSCCFSIFDSYLFWKPTIWDDLNDTVPLHFSICAMIFYVYACVYKIWVFLWTIWHIFSTSSRGQHRHLGSGTNMSSSTHRFGYHRSSGVAGCGGGVVFPRVWACTFQLIGNLRVWPYAWRSVQNEYSNYFICVTHLFWMCLRCYCTFQNQIHCHQKGNIIESIDDFRRMCGIFSQPGASKKHDSNLRGDTSNMERTT